MTLLFISMLTMLFILLCEWYLVFFFKQKTAYEMRISDWSSDVCSSDLWRQRRGRPLCPQALPVRRQRQVSNHAQPAGLRRTRERLRRALYRLSERPRQPTPAAV